MLAELRRLYSGTVEWLADGYIGLKEITTVAGPQESLKSWMVVDLARAVLTGGRWLGHFEVMKGPVVFIEAERASNLVYQTNQLIGAYGQGLDELVVVPPGKFFLRDRASQDLLRNVVAEHRPSLVIINSFRSVFRGKAADGADIADALGWLGRLAEEAGFAAVMIDQVNKAGATGLVRGTAAHADSLQKEYEADAILHVERGRDEVGRGIGPAQVYVGKRRAGDAGPAFSFEIQEIGDGVAPIWVEEIGVGRSAPRPRSSEDRVLAVLRADEPLSIQAIAKLVSQDGGSPVTDGTVKNNLTALKQQGRAQQQGRGLWQRSSSSSSFLRGGDDDDDREGAGRDDDQEQLPW